MSGHYNLVSWNVNGLRAAVKKGFLELLLEQKFDAVCVQETKASFDKLPREVKNIPGYYNYFVQRVTRFVFEIEMSSEEFLDLIERPAEQPHRGASPAPQRDVPPAGHDSNRRLFADDTEIFEPKKD